jgi:MFS family permease
VDALWHLSSRSQAEGLWRVLVAGLVGTVGGFLGGLLGQLLYGLTQLGPFLLIGWAFTGVLIGASPGAYDVLIRLSTNEPLGGAGRKFRNGLLGGAVGGVLGGLLYLALRGLWGAVLAERTDTFWSPSAMGFVALGMCIGLMMGLAQVILKETWLKVEAGFRAGRELLLTRPEVVIGRGEGCDVALFGDPEVEKQHARIVLRKGRYWLEDLASPEGTYLNGQLIDRPEPLRDGDLIEVGRAILRFGERPRRAEEE